MGQSKWSEDVGLVPERCAPFDASSSQCQPLQDCDLGATRFRAVNHHYVGGFYGGSDEDLIRRELVKGGPLVMSFEPKEDFMYYRSGSRSTTLCCSSGMARRARTRTGPCRTVGDQTGGRTATSAWPAAATSLVARASLSLRMS